jgi:hypothetical protein
MAKVVDKHARLRSSERDKRTVRCHIHNLATIPRGRLQLLTLFFVALKAIRVPDGRYQRQEFHMRAFVKAFCLGAMAAVFIPNGDAVAEGIEAGVGISIGGKSGINAGVGASIGGKSGVAAGLGASVGGKSGIKAGGGTTIGGKNGVTAGLGASIGGESGVDAGGGATIGGSDGVTAGLGANVGSGVKAGAGVGIGDGIDVGVGVSVGGGGTTVKPPLVDPDDPDDPTDPDDPVVGGDNDKSGTGNTPGSVRQVSRKTVVGASGYDLARYKRRCVDILANANSYDDALVALCRSVRGM